MEERRTLEFRYEVPEGYAPVHATGCYGGRMPSGEIAIDFFCERYATMDRETFEVSEDGTLGARMMTEPGALSVIRSVPCGVILSEKSAMEIHAWLGSVLGDRR